MRSIVVIGGGAAGIAAALSAVRNGFNVTLLEARSKLGGRLGTFKDKISEFYFDYGEHLILGGYENTLQLLQMLNCKEAVKIQTNLEIPFFHPTKGKFKFKTVNLMPPYDFMLGILKLKSLVFCDRIKLTSRLRKLISSKTNLRMPASEWLKTASEGEYSLFWKPLIISALNCSPEEVDMRMVKSALMNGFLRKGGLGFFLRPQEEIFHIKALTALKKAGVEVRLNSPVKGINLKGGLGNLEIKELEEGIKGDYYIFAVTPFDLIKIFQDRIKLLGLKGELSKIDYSDICNVHLVFERRIFQEDFGCLLETLPQWFFLQKWEKTSTTGTIGHAYSLTISAVQNSIPTGTNVVKTCLNDLKRCGANIQNNKLLYQKVVLMKRATVKLNCRFQDLRPKNETSLKNVYLAGDWLDTGLPATIESAVLSGFRTIEFLTRSSTTKSASFN